MGSIHVLVTHCRLLSERLRFRHRRIDYYDYLASLLDGADGFRTLKDIFLQDAARYGPGSIRGHLSQQWLHSYQRAGGDLYVTWSAHFPHNELALIRAAQGIGNTAVVQTLDRLAHVLRLMQQATQILHGTLWPALMAVLVAMGMSLAIPWFTLPRLLHTFDSVPANYYGTLTRKLIMFGGMVERYHLVLILVVIIVTGLVLWSLSNASGRWRQRLDNYLWWDIYRSINALRFLSFLAITLGNREQSVTRLRSALLLLQTGVSPWLARHISVMLGHVDQGVVGPAVFDTGLLGREQYWFFADMVNARGLHTGLSLSCERLRIHILGKVARQASLLRWGLLLMCVGFVLGVAVWHYAAIDELRRALTLYLSS